MKEKIKRIWILKIEPFFDWQDNFIIDMVRDIIWWAKGDKPYWKDAMSCHRKLCRFCGNKPFTSKLNPTV